MSNIVCEPGILYETSKKIWTSKSEGNINLEGGYASFVNEMIMIQFSNLSIKGRDKIDFEELNYNSYYFKKEDLKFDRDEINER